MQWSSLVVLICLPSQICMIHPQAAQPAFCLQWRTLLIQLLGVRLGLGAAVPRGIWASLSTVHVSMSDGELTAMWWGERKCLCAQWANLWWYKKFPTVLVFQKIASLQSASNFGRYFSQICSAIFRLLPAGPSASSHLNIPSVRSGVILNKLGLCGCPEGRGWGREWEERHRVCAASTGRSDGCHPLNIHFQSSDL